jgi:hypothetical protein
LVSVLPLTNVSLKKTVARDDTGRRDKRATETDKVMTLFMDVLMVGWQFLITGLRQRYYTQKLVQTFTSFKGGKR